MTSHILSFNKPERGATVLGEKMVGLLMPPDFHIKFLDASIGLLYVCIHFSIFVGTLVFAQMISELKNHYCLLAPYSMVADHYWVIYMQPSALPI